LEISIKQVTQQVKFAVVFYLLLYCILEYCCFRA